MSCCPCYRWLSYRVNGVSDNAFLAGYGAAQAVPGPLFTFSAYLGASIGIPTHHATLYSLAALIGIFLPGLLLMTAILPYVSPGDTLNPR